MRSKLLLVKASVECKNVNCPFHLWWSTTKMESFTEITSCIQYQIELQNEST